MCFIWPDINITINNDIMVVILDKFLKYVMLNEFQQDDNGNVIKYYNEHFDVIKLKKNDTCIVVDKKLQTVYSDLKIALAKLYKNKSNL